MKDIIRDLIKVSNIASANGYSINKEMERVLRDLMRLEGERLLISIKQWYLDTSKNINFTNTFKNDKGVWGNYTDYPFSESGVRKIIWDPSENLVTLVVQDGRGFSLDYQKNFKIEDKWINLKIEKDEGFYREYLYY